MSNTCPTAYWNIVMPNYYIVMHQIDHASLAYLQYNMCGSYYNYVNTCNLCVKYLPNCILKYCNA